MTMPTAAGSATRVASINSTLQPANPTTASPTNQLHSRPTGRGTGWPPRRAQHASNSPRHRVPHGLTT
jgi:hypothetical protein